MILWGVKVVFTEGLKQLGRAGCNSRGRSTYLFCNIWLSSMFLIVIYCFSFASYVHLHGCRAFGGAWSCVAMTYGVFPIKTFQCALGIICNLQFYSSSASQKKHCPLDSHESFIATFATQQTFSPRNLLPVCVVPRVFHSERGSVVVSIDPSGPRSNPRPPFRESERSGRLRIRGLPDHQLMANVSSHRPPSFNQPE